MPFAVTFDVHVNFITFVCMCRVVCLICDFRNPDHISFACLDLIFVFVLQCSSILKLYLIIFLTCTGPEFVLVMPSNVRFVLFYSFFFPPLTSHFFACLPIRVPTFRTEY